MVAAICAAPAVLKDAKLLESRKFTAHFSVYEELPNALAEEKPDYVLILPWNLSGEITRQVAYIHDWGGRFVVPIPEVRVLDE